MSECKSCKREILWAKTPNGRAMPLDPAEVNLCEVQPGPDGLEIVRQVRGHVSHFATCPQAGQHRKPRS